MAKDEDEDVAVEGEGEGEGKKRRFSPIVLAVMVLVPVLLIGGGAGAYFMFFKKPPAEHAEGAAAEGGHGEAGHGEAAGGHGEGAKPAAGKEGAAGVVAFYDLPDIIVNLNTPAGKRPSYLKLKVALEVNAPDPKTAIDPYLPRVLDTFQVFLRELRVEDLSGSQGLVRLREELLRRVNIAVQPTEVRDVLFKEMLIQ